MKKLLLVLYLITGTALAQQLPDDGFDKIRIAGPDKTIQAELKPVSSDPEMETDRLYYWCSGNSIHATQGGYSGRLLNGKYAEYYPNKNLKELGAFKKGLKNGIWKSWSENGTLTQWYTWKKGIMSGRFVLLDEAGKIKQTGRCRNGRVVAASKRSFWKKLLFFKKQ